MYRNFAKLYHLSSSNIAMDELKEVGFIDQNNNIDYSKCSNINRYQAQQLGDSLNRNVVGEN